MIDPHSPVTDGEVLFRSAPPKTMRWDNERKQWRITGEAFTDRAGEPSVNRAALDGNDPSIVKQSPDSFVLELHAFDVRSIVVEYNPEIENPPPNTPKTRKVEVTTDVRPDPLKGNQAHAVIVQSINASSPFSKLRNRLAQVSQICLMPEQSESVG